MSATLRTFSAQAPSSTGLQSASPWRRVLICSMAALPLLLAAGAQVAGARQQPISATRQPSPLVFEQYQVDLGVVPVVREVGGRFTFRNVSSRPLRIRELKPSCGCLQPRLEKDVIEPGESGTFLVRTLTAQQSPGRHEYTVKVISELLEAASATPPASGAGEPSAADLATTKQPVAPAGVTPNPEIEVTFSAHFPEKQVFVRPRALIFYQLSPQETTQDVAVIDQREKPLEVLGVSCPSPLVKVEMAADDVDEDGLKRRHLRVTVDGHVPAGRTRTLITVRTNDPAYPLLQVPMIIQGPETVLRPIAAMPLVAEPSQLRLAAAAIHPDSQHEIRIRGRKGEPVRILAIETSCPQLSAQVVPDKNDTSGVRIRVALKAPLTTTMDRQLVTVRTDDPLQPRLEIPVTFFSVVQQASDSREKN